MHSFGNGLDRFLANLIRVCYLVGAILGIFSFFSHLAIDVPQINWAFSGMIAGALVTHEFLQTRRVLIIAGRLMRGKGTKEQNEALGKAARSNLIILGILLACNVFFIWNYRTVIDTGVSPLPLWLGDILEAFALPLFGLAASLLVEVSDDAGVVLERARDAMLFSATKRAVRQQKNRINQAVQSGHNLTPIVTALMLDTGDEDGARRINLIEDGLEKTEKDSKLYHAPTRMVSGLKALGVTPQNVPQNEGMMTGPKAVKMPSTEGTKRTRKPRASVRLTKEQQVHKYLDKHPDATSAEIEKATGFHPKTVRKYHVTWYDKHSIQLVA
jgi:hypothetical protein